MSTATPYKPTTEDVKRLREATEAGMLDCRNALVRANGDYETAKKHLLDQGVSKAAKKAEREVKEGIVGSYIHSGGKIGVLVEVNCETDFVARGARFGELVRDIAMHVAAMSPEYLDRAAVPAEKLAEVKAELAKTLPPGKPADKIEQILEGKLNKWYGDRVLLDQPFVKDDDKTVGERIGIEIGVLGENIQVRRFAKFTLGEE